MYERGSYRHPKSVDLLSVSITKAGRITLNRRFVKKYKIERSTKAELYWAKSAKQIAVIFSDKARPDAFPLVFEPHGRAAYVVAIQFFRSNQLNPKDYGRSLPLRFEITQPEKLGIEGEAGPAFVIDLSGSSQ